MKKNLTHIVAFIESTLKDFLETEADIVVGDIAVGLVFSIEPYDICHWATNMSREDGINLFSEVAKKMQKQFEEEKK